jgi:hypothetical protein
MKRLGILLIFVLCGCVSNRTATISVTAKITAFYPQAMNEDYTDGGWAAYDAVIFQIISPAQWQGTNLTIYCFSGDTNIIFKTVGDVFQFQIAEAYLNERPGHLFDGAIEKPKRITAATTPDAGLWLIEEMEIPLYHSSTIDPQSGHMFHVEYCGAKLSKGDQTLHIVYRPIDYPNRNPGFQKGDLVSLSGLDKAKDYNTVEGRDYWIYDIMVNK